MAGIWRHRQIAIESILPFPTEIDMSFRRWREQKRLSQERIAEMSGLSLRTVQRLEAGHRVSYSSLRALAVTFEVDVDLLERELYTMNKTADDFVEAPRWVRLLNDAPWFRSGTPVSRQTAYCIEAVLLGLALVFFAASFLVTSELMASLLRVGAFFELVCGYLVSVFGRIVERYKLWPSTVGATSNSQQIQRTWRTRTAEYGFSLGVGILVMVLLFWLAL